MADEEQKRKKSLFDDVPRQEPFSGEKRSLRDFYTPRAEPTGERRSFKDILDSAPKSDDDTPPPDGEAIQREMRSLHDTHQLGELEEKLKRDARARQQDHLNRLR